MGKEFQKKRKGITIVTSVSITEHIKKLIDKHNISPSQALVKGVAIELFERGEPIYQSETNKVRAKFLNRVKQNQEIRESFDTLKERLANLIKEMEDIENSLKGGIKKDG